MGHFEPLEYETDSEPVKGESEDGAADADNSQFVSSIHTVHCFSLTIIGPLPTLST